MFKEAMNEVVKEVAEKWLAGQKSYSSIKTMINDTIKSYNIDLIEAAAIVEKAVLFYGGERINIDPEAYWAMVERMK